MGKNGVKLSMSIGENIKKYRKKRGLTQKQLGEKVHKSEITIRKYENADSFIPTPVLFDLMKVLDITPVEILSKEGSGGFSCGDLFDFEEFEKEFYEKYPLANTEKASNKNSIGIRFLDRSKLSDEKEQIIKVVEEMYEFINATGDENQLEEFYDLVQASLNLLQIRNFTLQEIQEAEQKHIEKLRKRGWNV